MAESGSRGVGREQARERGRVGQRGEDGFDDHRIIGIEVRVGDKNLWVALAADNPLDSMDDLVPAWIAVAFENGIEALLLRRVLGCHEGRKDEREVLLQVLPRAGEVAFGLASETAAFPR